MPVKVKGDKTRVPSAAELQAAIHVERLICTDCSDNSNKFWHGYCFSNGDAYCEWGRVDYTKQHEYYAFGDTYEAKRWLDKKTKDKMSYTDKAAYTRQQTIAGNGVVKTSSPASGNFNLKSIAQKEIEGDSEVKKLVAWLAEVNIHQITANTQITYNVQTGTFSTPLGLVTPNGIDEARVLLNDIADFVVNRDWGNTRYQKLLADYLRIVPQNVGMRRGWHETILSGSDALQKQGDILDSLAASLSTPAAPQWKMESKRVFETKLDTVTDSVIFSSIKTKYNSAKGNHHDVQDYDVKKAWNIHIPSVRSAFEKDGIKVGNFQELYHGSKASNLLSCLRLGLIIPPKTSPHVCGRMWHDGIYMSSQPDKALRYATNAWTSGGNTDRKFMFLCKAALGKQHIPRSGDSWGYRLPSGYDSCWAKAGVSGVMNHEQIVYRTSQVDLLYLIEFTPFGK